MSSQTTVDSTPIASSMLEASIAIVKRSATPLTVAEIANAARGKKPNSDLNRRLAHELSQLPEDSGVYEWPSYNRSRIYCGQPLRTRAAEAFLQALDEQPLTAAGAAGPVGKILKRASQESALKEVRAVAPGLVSANRILAFAASRQLIVYFSFNWLEKKIPARTPQTVLPDAKLPDAILEAIQSLQSGLGNYVRIDYLRAAPSLRRVVDNAVIELADSQKLVLARYDGPRPLPEEEKPNYVEDRKGDLFIGVALPRPSTVAP